MGPDTVIARQYSVPVAAAALSLWQISLEELLHYDLDQDYSGFRG
jgi:hypothetical protein